MPSRNYNTRQRESVLACIKESAGEHVTAQEVVSRLQSKNEKVGLTTVYRCLEKLVGEGVLVKYTSADREGACFRLAECGSDNCFHMKCEKCGGFFHIECDHLLEAATHIFDEHGFTVDPYKTVFYGVCESCAASDK